MIIIKKGKRERNLLGISVGIHGRSCYTALRSESDNMLVYNLTLCVVIASFYLSCNVINGAKLERDDDHLMFGSDDQSRVSELGSTREENLNCLLQFDQFLADKWTSDLDLGGISNTMDQDSSSLINQEEKEQEEGVSMISDIRIRLAGLENCMSNITKKLKNPGVQKCMKDLIGSEIENDGFMSLPALYDYTLPLPYLTFLDIREMAKVLYQNRTWEELSNDEINVFQKASDYLRKDKSGRDKVFVFDQACDWQNLAALKKREENLDDMIKEFKQQVIRTISMQIANGFFTVGDLKPGTWINVYRLWAPVRLQNLKELETLLKDLRTQKFTTRELCKYATTLGNFFAEQELKILIPEKVTSLRLTVGELGNKIKTKEGRLCNGGATKNCTVFRGLKKSYENDVACVKSFGDLLSNHILYSIIEKFAYTEPRVTYPEVACKRRPSPDKISIRYCRCVGSFCTFRNVGEVKADFYKLTNDVVTKA